jgi:hypothetical protein
VVCLLYFACPIFLLAADDDHCAVCEALLTGKLYSMTDKVTGEKVHVCPDCEKKPGRCFMCGLPVKDDALKLSDGRRLCERDAKSAVLDDAVAQQICQSTRDNLDHLLARFMSFPETNVTVKLLDRVDLQELFKFAGNDYVCPNVWGLMQTRTRNGAYIHKMSLLTGLPAANLKATCAHEYTHAWLNERMSVARKKTLDADAIEGFCELIAFLLAESDNDQDQIAEIKLNGYTRGQIDVFIETQRVYGLSDIIDWMLYGTDGRLESSNLDRIRVVELPKGLSRPQKNVALYTAARLAPAAPDTLVLKGISGTPSRPFALINDHTFEENEQAKVSIGQTNLMIRCLSIRNGKVKVLLVGSGQTQELQLKQAAKR